MAKKTVQLPTPIDTPTGKVSAIELREPTYNDYMEIGGLPVTMVETGNGGRFEQEATGILELYIERCVDIDPNCLRTTSLANTLRIRAAMLDFFREAMMAGSASTTSSASAGA